MKYSETKRKREKKVYPACVDVYTKLTIHFTFSGVHLQEVTATISKDLVFEFFGKGPFKCECNAWSPRGKAKSQPATVEVACK